MQVAANAKLRMLGLAELVKIGKLVTHRVLPCNMHHDATCNMRHVTCDMRHATCDMRHATCDMQHATCGMRHATMRCAAYLRKARR